MATSADVLAKFKVYYNALQTENTAYTNSATVGGFQTYYATIVGGSGLRPTLPTEADLDTYNTALLAQNNWDKAFMQAQADYTNDVHATRLAEVALIAVLPPNQWVEVPADSTAPANPQAWIGYRLSPVSPPPPVYPMVRMVLADPTPSLFTDTSSTAITSDYTTYQAKVTAANTCQTTYNTFITIPPATSPTNPRPLYPPPGPPPYIIEPGGDSAYSVIAAAQAVWDQNFANAQYALTYALIDQRNAELALILDLPPDIWVEISTVSPVVYLGYSSTAASPAITIQTTVPTGPF